MKARTISLNARALLAAWMAAGPARTATVQGAVDAIPLGNTNYTLINIGPGSFFGIVDVASKNNGSPGGQAS